MDYETIEKYANSSVSKMVATLSEINDDRVKDIIAGVDKFESNGDDKVALVCLMDALITCISSLAETNNEAYYDGYMKFLRKAEDILEKEPIAYQSTNYYFGILAQIEKAENSYPDNPWLRALIMETVEKAEIFSVNTNQYADASEFYNYQRDKLIDYDEFMDIDPFIAKVDKNSMVPNILAGKSDVARKYGAEAFNIYLKLYERDEEQYAGPFIELCSNLGGIYLDADELETAENLFDTATKLLDRASETIKNSPNVQLSANILDKNKQALENKKNNTDIKK